MNARTGPALSKASAADPQARLAAYRRNLLDELERQSLASGRVLLDGRWSTPDEAHKEYRKLFWRGGLIVLEVFGLFAGLALTASVVGFMLAILVGLGQ